MTDTTFFGQRNIQYPELTSECGEIPIDDFLVACDGVVTFIGFLGSAFSLVSRDVAGNVTKLRTKYEENKANYKTVEDLLQSEMERREDKKQYTSTLEGVLWLKRALDFVRHVLVFILEEHSKNTPPKSDSMIPALTSSYKNTLKKSHGLPIQITFKGFMLLCPYKSSLIKQLANGKENDQTLNDMKNYVHKMSPCVDKLITFYAQNGLENDKKI